MTKKRNTTPELSRRQFIGTAVTSAAGLALSAQSAFGFPAILQGIGKPNSKFNGVQIGTNTFSYRSMPGYTDPEAVLRYTIESGINAVELRGPAAETFAGIPQNPNGGGRRGRGADPAQMTPAEQRELEEQQAAAAAHRKAVADWRTSVAPTAWEKIRKMYKDAGVTIYAWKPNGVFAEDSTDAEIDYGFRMAKALGATHVTVELPDDPALTLRLGKLAEKNKMLVAYHTHLQGNIDAFDEAFAQSEYNRSNVDIGHYVAAGGDPMVFLKKFYDKISSIHLKDRTRDGGNLPWGEGETPLVEALQLMRDQKYKFAGSIELEYRIPEGSDAVKEVANCVEFSRKALEA